MRLLSGRSLKSRLTLHFSIFVAVAMLLIIASVSVVSTSATLANLKEQFRSESLHEMDLLEQGIASLVDQVKRLSRNHFIINGLVDPSGRERYLSSIVRDFSAESDIATLSIVDFSGQTIFSTSDSVENFQGVQHIHSVLSVGASGLWMAEKEPGKLIIAEPVTYFHTTQGAVIVETHMSSLAEKILRPKHQGYQKLFSHGKTFYSKNYLQPASYTRIRLEAGERHPLLHTLGMGLEGGIPRNVFLRPVYGIVALLGGIGGFFIAAAVCLSQRMGRSISQPILELCERVGRAEAEPVRCSPLGTNDELETLARAFDRRTEGLVAAQESYRYLFEKNPQPMWVYDLETLRFLTVNDVAVDHYGYTRDEFLRMSIKEIRPQEDIPGLLENIAELSGGLDRAGIWRHCRKDGTVILVDIHSHALVFEGRHAELVLAVDVTEKIRAEQALQHSEREKSALLNSIPDIAWLKDTEGRFIAVNRAFARASGCPSDAIVGRCDLDLFNQSLAEKYVRDDREVMEAGKIKRVEERFIDSQGKEIWLDTIKVPFYNHLGEVAGTVGIARDISERRDYERQLEHQATHDSLTGLPNRTLLTDRIRQAIARAARSGKMVAVVLLDLDRFKIVNDSLGHSRGDELLQQFSERIRQRTRAQDTFARLGGDEFVLMLTEIEEISGISVAVDRVRSCLCEPFLIAERDIQMAVSVGIAVFPQDGKDWESLLRNADSAMFEAKRRGRDTVQFFAPAMDLKARESLELESELRKALVREELLLLYQPKVDVVSGKIIGCEALVRWRHPERGVIPPGVFIPLAEESGLINAVGKWVLQEACAQARAWQDAGLPQVTMAVNLSARQFRRGNLVQEVENLLGKAGLDPRRLELEITESAVIDDPESAIETMRSFKKIGVRLGLDDFGTGFSSLNYLRRFPIDIIKIDRSFIAEVPGAHESEAVAGGIFAIARDLGIEAVAEGVETREQLEFLRRHRCPTFQGFLFSRPVPADEFVALLGKQEDAHTPHLEGAPGIALSNTDNSIEP